MKFQILPQTPFSHNTTNNRPIVGWQIANKTLIPYKIEKDN